MADTPNSPIPTVPAGDGPERGAAAADAAARAIGCHAGKDEMRRPRPAAGKSETLERTPRTIPEGAARPAAEHVPGLRLAARRPAHAPHRDVLSGSACCVYGLTFTSHFYGARRTVGYVPFNSETLVTGKLFEDIRDAVYKLADPALYDAVVDHQPVRADGLGRAAAAAAEGDQRRAHHRHRRAGLRRADACRGQGRARRRDAALRAHRGGAGARCRRRAAAAREADGHAARRDVPGRSGGHRHDARAARAGRGSGGADARVARALRALDCAVVAAIHPFYTASFREFEAAGRTIVGSAPVGYDGTAAWLEAIGEPAASRARSTRRRTASCRRSRRARGAPIKGRITLSGYEGSELLVARLLVESGADLRYVGTACPRTPWSDPDREWLEAQGVRVQFRASLEQDLAAMRRVRARPRDRHHAGRAEGQGAAIPALYFTNLISARPLMGPAGAGSLAQVVNAALNKPRFDEMKAFFEASAKATRPASGKTRRGPPGVPRAIQAPARPRREGRKAEEMV
jgi:3,8-divinyl chlorophyllide a/chlorophyllide a reductase subunit Y